MRFRGTLSNREITRNVCSTRISRISRLQECIRVFLQLQVATFTPLHLYPIYFRRQGVVVRTNGTHVHAFANSMQQGLQDGKRERLPEWKSSTNQMLPHLVFFPTAYPKCIRIVSHARGTLPVQFNFPRFDRLILYRLSLRNQIIFRWSTRARPVLRSRPSLFFSNKFFFLEYLFNNCLLFSVTKIFFFSLSLWIIRINQSDR